MQNPVVRHVRLAEAPSVPWRNGGGTTRELWVEGDGPCGFAVRISVADVEQAGPFSMFPGVDRVIALLSGAGFVLERDGFQVRCATGAPWAFAGEDRWSCALIAGPVRDLNLMVDRARWRGALVLRAPGELRAGLVVAAAAGRIADRRVEAGDLLELAVGAPCTAPAYEVVLTNAGE